MCQKDVSSFAGKFWRCCHLLLIRWSEKYLNNHSVFFTLNSVLLICCCRQHTNLHLGCCVSCPDLFSDLCIVNEISICENCRLSWWMFSFMTFCDVDVLSHVLKFLPFGTCQRCELCCAYLNDLFCLCNLTSVKKYSLVKVRRLR